MEKIITSKGIFDITIPKDKMPATGEVYIVCPICSPTREPAHQKEKKLAINVNKIPRPWRCNHCNEGGYIVDEDYYNRMTIKPILEAKKTLPVSDSLVKWFWEERKISKQTLLNLDISMSTEPILQNKVKEGNESVRGTYVNRKCINFKYKKDGILIDIKYRDEDKNFKLISGATKIFYNLDAMKGQKSVVIVEGEMDVLAYHEAGITNVISVPNGSAISPQEIEEFKRTGRFRENLNLNYLDICIEYFKEIETIYLATDDDIPGLKLREELARRLGKDRCRYIKFSEYTKQDGTPCKDANDLLVSKGKEYLANSLSNEYAHPYPISGVTTASQYWDKMERIFDNGRQKGYSTGYKSLDPHFNWMPGWLVLGNGYPGEGKSSLLFNLIVISTVLYDWKWGMYCPENYPPENIIDTLTEILVGDTADISFGDRMSKKRYQDAIQRHIDKHFFFVDNEEGYTPSELRRVKKNLIRQHGINGFLTDPWKNLKHDLGNKSIDMYLQEELAAEVRIAIKNDLINLICHHPPTPPRDKDKNYPAPSQFDLIGGQVWSSTTYSMMCIHKHDRTSWQNTLAEIHIQKNKEHKLAGFPTDRANPVLLKFDRRSNRFLEREDISNLSSAYTVYPFTNYEAEKQINFEGF
jgi:twinkle protein